MAQAPTAAPPDTAPDAVLRIEGGALIRGGDTLIGGVDWTVRRGERWVVLGPNGAGKTSLLRIASTYESVTKGRTYVLSHQIGRVDVRELRRRIALVSAYLEEVIPPRTRAVDIVVMGRDARLRRWHETYDERDEARARATLERFGCGELIDAPFGDLSEGERQRVQLARAVMTDPELLLLDEPSAGLDLVGRELLLATLSDLASASRPAAIVLVTHHPEEVPAGFTHALLLRDGGMVAAGPIEQTITSEHVSACFGAPLTVERRDGRFAVRLSG